MLIKIRSWVCHIRFSDSVRKFAIHNGYITQTRRLCRCT